MKQEKYGIHWFRRDLRVQGNRALLKHAELSQGRLLGLFCFDKKFLDRPDFSVNRFQFFLSTLASLQTELRGLGGDLLVLDVGPFEAFPLLVKQLEKHKIPLPSVVSWSRDYEPFAVQRDKNLEKMITSYGIEFFHERDHLLIEPWELEKADRTGYQVFTPFSKKWLEIFQRDNIQRRLAEEKKSIKLNLDWAKFFQGHIHFPDFLSEYLTKNGKKTTIDIPKSGSEQAKAALNKFNKKLNSYSEGRDFPSLNATSHVSIYLKNGSLTVPQIISSLKLCPYIKPKSSPDKYFSELIWREFYYHVLYRHPRVEKEAFLLQYKNIKWQNDPKLFKAWQNGQTGYPIVDAGMRQLKTTGWMHNRVRMIVASFLTKDLLIDWRWGEEYFMQTLLDGDIAPNNGGWQWAASTGCDPQPYFRIFNPWLQSAKYDPEAVYIKKYVPELKNLSPKEIHQPIIHHRQYPAPIVDHAMQKIKALKMYQNASAMHS